MVELFRKIFLIIHSFINHSCLGLEYDDYGNVCFVISYELFILFCVVGLACHRLLSFLTIFNNQSYTLLIFLSQICFIISLYLFFYQSFSNLCQDYVDSNNQMYFMKKT